MTEVSLALTIATFESKMTMSFIQMREDARENPKADCAADREREERMEKCRNEERAEERKIWAEQRLKIQNMFRMFLPMLNNVNQQLLPPTIQQQHRKQKRRRNW